ncbi:ABC transporter permease [Brevibacillus sp. SYSU BS000544]|uniref:ABC transporter permease n=1 Tax=Brevibacillus sp. SYSU BS000544 TaxID=3416443 RepID=UPI003CE46719
MSRFKNKATLYLGFILVSFLLVIAVIGPYIAPYDVTFKEKVQNVEVNGKTVIINPPLPPSSTHWLGTDKWGYDLLTLILHGAKYTVFLTILIAALRILLGTWLGLYIGMAERKQNWWLALENAWSHIPLVLPVYFILLGVNINSPLSTAELVTMFVCLVAVLGTPSVVSSIRQKTEQVKEMPYILAAVSLGASKNRLIFQHILPQLKEQVIIIFVTEIIAAMALMGQLGLFNLFIGGTSMTTDPILYASITNEWAGLVGQARGHIYGNTWIFLMPLGAFVLAIASFSILAKGLRDRYQQTYSRTPYM